MCAVTIEAVLQIVKHHQIGYHDSNISALSERGASKHDRHPRTRDHDPRPAATANISISTNTAIGLLGVPVTLFGGVMTTLPLHTLNTATDQIKALDVKLSEDIKALDEDINAPETKITTVETSLSEDIDALAQQQADPNETLSVLLAVLNVRKEVEAAKAH